MDSLAESLGAALKAKGWMLALAESCTGGMVAANITEVAGSSAWFDRGFVTYSNQAKMEMLGVPEDVLMAFGAVSSQTAEAMAIGALRNSQASIAGAITGIAGPSGGSADKPVGMVCFALAKHVQTTDFALEKYSQTMDFALAKYSQTMDFALAKYAQTMDFALANHAQTSESAEILTQQTIQFFKGDRQAIREQACAYLLTQLRIWLTV